MTTDHRAEAAERLRACDYQRQQGDLKGARLEAATALVHATLADKQDPLRSLLATLIERWEEVVEAYKPEDMGGEWDDTTRRYQHYRHTYQRAIRDLQHVLDAGQMPCGLMTVEERRRGDCGQVHDDDPDGLGRAAGRPHPASAVPADDPWAPDPQIQKLTDARRVTAGHLAEMFLDGENTVVRTWARGLVHELNRVGIDLSDEITAHMRRLTLNDEPPF